MYKIILIEHRDISFPHRYWVLNTKTNHLSNTTGKYRSYALHHNNFLRYLCNARAETNWMCLFNRVSECAVILLLKTRALRKQTLKGRLLFSDQWCRKNPGKRGQNQTIAQLARSGKTINVSDTNSKYQRRKKERKTIALQLCCKHNGDDRLMKKIKIKNRNWFSIHLLVYLTANSIVW